MSVLNGKVFQLLIFGLIGFYIGTLYNSNYQGACSVLYVSQEEIMELEQERIKNEDLQNRQLFFGNTEEAVRLAISLPLKHQKPDRKIVYSISRATGDGVSSISKEIHQEIIENLSKKKDKK